MKRILCLRIENPTAPPLEALHTVAARCKQFTPLVGIDPDVFPQSVLLDITNVPHLFGGEAALIQRIIDTLQGEDWHLCAAIADTPGAAWALAWYGRKRVGSGQWAVGSGQESVSGTQYSVLSTAHCPPPTAHHPPPTTYYPLPTTLSSLPLKALRLTEPTIALLHSLGIWQIGQLQALPRCELSSRFGPDLLNCLDRVTGRLFEPLPAWDPPPQFEVRWSAEFPTARRETIEAALEHLVHRLATMLTQAGCGAMRLECLLQCTAGESRQVAVGLFRPTARAKHLAELLQVQFESLQLPGPVEGIRLTATSTARLEIRQQEMFFQQRSRAAPYHLAGLIDRLSNRLGQTCVMRVRLLPDAQPELACRYTPLVQIKGSDLFYRSGLKAESRSAESSHTGATVPVSQPRPLRLLMQPLRLPNGVNGPFSFAGQQQRVVRRVGPERIETGWWRGRSVARDYYRIETATGRCYWAFRRLPAGPWFLHGVFD